MIIKVLALIGSILTASVHAQQKVPRSQKLPRCVGSDVYNFMNPCRVRECRATKGMKYKKANKCLRAPTCEELRNSDVTKFRWKSNMCDKEGATECYQIRRTFPFALTTSKKENRGDPITCEDNTAWFGFCVTDEATDDKKVVIEEIRRTIINESKELFAVASHKAGCSGFNSGNALRPYNNQCGKTLSAKWLPVIAQQLQGDLKLETITTDDGRERKYYIFRSSLNLIADANNLAPLVVDLHGYGECPEGSAMYTDWLNIAAVENMVVVWPFSTESFGINIFSGEVDPFQTSWSVPSLPSEAVLAGVDDVSFLRDMIHGIQDKTKYNIDSSRLYMAGSSHGSAMAQYFAYEEQSMTAGVVAASFFLLEFPTTPAAVGTAIQKGLLLPSTISANGLKLVSNVPLFNVHGRLDDVIPYNSAGSPVGTGAVENTLLWSAINECTTQNTNITADYQIQKNSGCGNDVEVQLLTVEGAGHLPYRYFEFSALGGSNVSSTQMGWDFIKDFSKLQSPTIPQKVCQCALKHNVCGQTCAALIDTEDQECSGYAINGVCGGQFPSDVSYAEHCPTIGEDCPFIAS